MLSGVCVGEAEATRLVVCDAGPLIHLDELGCLDLLADFREIMVADAVWREVLRHRPTALRRRSIQLSRISASSVATTELLELSRAFSLGKGELESLQLMAHHPDAVFLCDDAAARLVATQLGYEVHGTIGVVVRASRRGQRTKRQVLNRLQAIPKRSTLYISKTLLADVIDQVRIS
jgi:predicted nucleic acid-binding protein